MGNMTEREQAHDELRQATVDARNNLEYVLEILGWPDEPALSHAIDRLVQLEDRLC